MNTIIGIINLFRFKANKIDVYKINQKNINNINDCNRKNRINKQYYIYIRSQILFKQSSYPNLNNV